MPARKWRDHFGLNDSPGPAETVGAELEDADGVGEEAEAEASCASGALASATFGVAFGCEAGASGRFKLSLTMSSAGASIGTTFSAIAGVPAELDDGACCAGPAAAEAAGADLSPTTGTGGAVVDELGGDAIGWLADSVGCECV